MRPLLTIVTVTKDDPTGLFKTVKSTKWLRNKHSVVHIIIDSSADTAKKNQQLSESYHLRYIHQPPAGIYGAMNLGLAQVTTDWVWFLNGGDTLHPQFPTDFLITQLSQTHADGCIYQIESNGEVQTWPSLSDMLPFPSLWIPHPSAIIRTQTLKRLSGFDTRYSIAADGDLWYRLIYSGAKLDIINIPLTQFSPGGASSQSARTSAEVFRFLRRHWFTLLKWWLGRGLTLYRIPKHFYVQSKA